MALVELDPLAAEAHFHVVGRDHALRDGRAAASGAGGIVDPCEEFTFEPLEKGANDAVLIRPSGLLTRAGRRLLQHGALLLCLVVDTFEGDVLHGLVQQPGILPLHGRLGEEHELVSELQVCPFCGGCGYEGKVGDAGGARGGIAVGEVIA